MQLRPFSRAQERDRLGLSRVESQGGWLCELWLRHGRTWRPAAPRNGDRASARPDSLIGPLPVATLWAHYQGGNVDAGLAELGAPAGAMIDDLLWWTAALKTARASAS